MKVLLHGFEQCSKTQSSAFSVTRYANKNGPGPKYPTCMFKPPNICNAPLEERKRSAFPPVRTYCTDDTARQLARSRAFATVTDDPLDKKVEMTNWEKVRLSLCTS